MQDARVWEFEESLWTGSAEHYRDSIDPQCLMVLPEPPFVMAGKQAIDAVSDTPRWSRVTTTQRQVMRPQEGLIVVAYQAEAFRGFAGRPFVPVETVHQIAGDAVLLQHHGDGLRGVEGWVALAAALRVGDERLLELIGEAEVIHHQAARLVAEDTVHAGDGLHEAVALHRLVGIHRVQAGRVETGQPRTAG